MKTLKCFGTLLVLIIIIVLVVAVYPKKGGNPSPPSEPTNNPSQTPTPGVEEVNLIATLDPQKTEVWQRSPNQKEQQVVNSTQANKGDEVWTDEAGEALLEWRDLSLLLYRNGGMVIKNATPLWRHIFLELGAAVYGASLEQGERVVVTTPNADVVIIGTTIMVAYHPDLELTVVRVFDGVSEVSNRDGDIRTEHVGMDEWALISTGKPPQVSNQLEEMRNLAREFEMWDVFHEIELEVAGGFGPEASQVTEDDVQIVFVEPESEPLCEIITGRLNLRTGPDRQYEPPIRSLPKGTNLIPLGRIDTEDWIYVQVKENGQEGWVSGNPDHVSCNRPIPSLPTKTAPAPIDTPIPTPTPYVACGPQHTTVEIGACTNLTWDIENVSAVYLDDSRVADHSQKEVCPTESQTFVLRIVTPAEDRYCKMTVEVVDTSAPVISNIKTEPIPGRSSGQQPPICYDDFLSVTAQVVDESRLEKVLIKALYFGESASWNMSGGGNEFEYPMWAGHDFTIYAEDEYGNSSETDLISTDCVSVSTIYDFIEHAPDASWSSSEGNDLWVSDWTFDETYPVNAVATWAWHAVLEDGSVQQRALLTVPPPNPKACITGLYYPSITLKEGDFFVARVGILGTTLGGVTFQAFGDQDADGPSRPMTSVFDIIDGQLKNLELDLSYYAGTTTSFSLRVCSYQDIPEVTNYGAVWVEAGIERRGN